MSEKNHEMRILELFRSIGWDARAEVRMNKYIPDIALYDNDICVGVVEVKMILEPHNKKAALYKAKRQASSFMQNNKVYFFLLFVENQPFLYNDNCEFIQIDEIPTPINYKLLVQKPAFKIGEGVESIQKPVAHTSDGAILEQLMVMIQELQKGQQEIKKEINLAKDEELKKLEQISKQIKILSEQITGYQSLTSRFLERADSETEKEKILSVFTDELIDRINKDIKVHCAEKDLEYEENQLKVLFEDAYDKMEDSTKKFILTSKTLYRNQESLGDLVDYSGVCVLITKALENELHKRFCDMFLEYLSNKYPGSENYAQYPTSLLDRNGRPIRSRDFTMGTVAYILCYREGHRLTDAEKENNKGKLLEFSKECLFTGKSDEEIISLLSEYARNIEEIRTRFRNPSAHTNSLQKVEAKECMDLVIDVEKLLKKMLDSFNV